MATTITLKADGQEYLLEFTRHTVSVMEQNGFSLEKISETPINAIPQLFDGAFMAHNRFLNQKIKDAIWAKIPNKMDFVTKLGEMYAEASNTLFDEPEEGAEGNVTWGVTQ